jgi:hypothetical protein
VVLNTIERWSLCADVDPSWKVVEYKGDVYVSADNDDCLVVTEPGQEPPALPGTVWLLGTRQVETKIHDVTNKLNRVATKFQDDAT